MSTSLECIICKRSSIQLKDYRFNIRAQFNPKTGRYEEPPSYKICMADFKLIRRIDQNIQDKLGQTTSPYELIQIATLYREENPLNQNSNLGGSFLQDMKTKPRANKIVKIVEGEIKVVDEEVMCCTSCGTALDENNKCNNEICPKKLKGE